MSELNFQQMFLGSETAWIFLVEILIRTTVMYFWLLLNVRLMGKRGIGELSAFEFIIVIALGSAAGDPMFYEEVPLLHGMAVITTVVLLERVISRVSERHRGVERVVTGSPTLLIRDGKVIDNALDGQDLNMSDLFEMLRQEGIRNVSEVEFGVLEASGKLSVIRYPKDKIVEGESTVLEKGIIIP